MEDVLWHDPENWNVRSPQEPEVVSSHVVPLCRGVTLEWIDSL